MELKERVLDNLVTTIGGLVAAAMTGVAVAVTTGQTDWRSIGAAAAVAAAGAWLKNPRWIGSQKP